MGRITVKLVGVRFRNRDKTSRQELLGKLYDDYWIERKEDAIQVALVADQDNEHDPNAVAVMVQDPEPVRGQIGFLPKDYAKVLHSRLHMVTGTRLVHMGIGRGRGAILGATIRILVRSVVKDDEGRDYEFEDLDYG